MLHFALKITFIYIVSKVPIFFIFTQNKPIISMVFGIGVSTRRYFPITI